MNNLKLNRGVIYFNYGTGCLPRLFTSIHSLRKHYSGPVTIISQGDDSGKFFKSISKEDNFHKLDVHVKDITIDVPEGHSFGFLITTLADTYTPYDLTIWLDADTLVRGSIDELFDEAEQHEVAVPNFANWGTAKGTIAKRINFWKQYYPEIIDKALNFGPAVNCGVYAWKHGARFMADWYKLTLPGRDSFIPNETCMQVVLPQYQHKIVDQKFNCSCKYSDCYDADVRVIHYHGRKHCRLRDGKLLNHADLWMAEYKEVLAENICGIKDWEPGGDRNLSKYYKQLKTGGNPSVKKEKKKKESDFKPAKKVRTNMEPVTDKSITIVTAVTPNYLDKLKSTFPTWFKKKQFKDCPIVIFHHGFDKLDVLAPSLNEWAQDMKNTYSCNIKLVPWDMEKYDSMRELMLSAFVLGAPAVVETPYCVKIDCDTFFLDEQDVFADHHFTYDVAGHKWRYTKPGEWIAGLDDWCEKNKIPGNPYLNKAGREEALKSKRFGHPRIASWICLHKTSFLLEIAGIVADHGGRLPVPSHDTFVWYMAQRLPDKCWAWHNFKKNGAGTHTNLEVIKERVK